MTPSDETVAKSAGDGRPAPLEGGRIAQTLVEYLGQRSGSFTVRGHGSKRDYRFNCNADRYRWVRHEDLPHFQSLVDFHIHEDRTIDPRAQEMQVLVQREVERQRIEAEEHVATQDQPAARRGGRPRVARQILQKMWHRRHHALPPWTPEEIAEQLPDLATSANPARAVSTRLTRFKRDYPELINEDRCPHCR